MRSGQLSFKKRTAALIPVMLLLLFVCSFKPGSGDIVIRQKHDFFTSDNLSNVYLVKGEELVKFLPGGKMASRYSNLKLGNITSIDATNPLKIILYYRDFQQVVFLDNQLSPNSTPVSLEKLGLEQAELVCAGANNSLWIYNKQNNELIRFDENSKKVASTGNLKQVLQSEITPSFMMEHNGFLYMNDTSKGIFVFDIFGAFSKIISITGLHHFDVDGEIIYYQRDSALCSYQHRIFEEACTTLPFSIPSSVKYLNKKIFAGYKDSLLVKELSLVKR